MSNHVGNGSANGTSGFFKLSEFTQLVRNLDRKPKTIDNILDVIGNTPMVKLNRIPKDEGIQCEMYAKCEFLNPGGSIKDRIAYRMFLQAEEKGILIPGKSVIIEPTSGNTGIGLALAAAVRGYRCIIVLPEKMSDEKVNTLLALGAEIIRTPTEAPSESPESNIGVAKRLLKEIPNAVVLDQYNNPCNPLAHYEGTAEEILWSLDDEVDMVVIGAGTGGTISGIAHKVKERCPSCVIVGVDPYGSILAEPDTLNDTDVQMYEVEGIGYDFFPKTLDRAAVDKWVKSEDHQSLNLAKRLIKEEGLLVGGSSGSVMYGALQMAKTLKAGQKCVVLFPDSIRNYMTKFIKDQWMEARGFKHVPQRDDLWWWKNAVSESMVKPINSVPLTSSVKEAYNKLQLLSTQVLAVTDTKGSIVGLFTSENVRHRLVNLSSTMNDSLDKFLVKKYYKVDLNKKPTLGEVSRMLDIAPYVVVVTTEANTNKMKPVGLMTSDEFLTQIAVDKC